jgi:hypothetical protein
MAPGKMQRLQNLDCQGKLLPYSQTASGAYCTLPFWMCHLIMYSVGKSFGAESVVFQVAIEKLKDQDI